MAKVPLPSRKSWKFAPALWSAATLCEELLLMEPDPSQLRVIVAPLEPAITNGIHPCSLPRLGRKLLYTPKLAMLIRDESSVADANTAALVAIVSITTLKALSLFFFLCLTAAVLMWLACRMWIDAACLTPPSRPLPQPQRQGHHAHCSLLFPHAHGSSW